MPDVLHLTALDHWRAAGAEITAPSLATEGFVHASPDVPTLLAVADRFYAGADAPQVALVVDTDRVGAEVRWEAAVPAPPPGVPEGTLFPHVYGPIPRAAVTGVRYLRRDPWGAYTAAEERGATAEALDLLPHPEGGWYRSTWRAAATVRPEGYPGPRPTASAVLFLLGAGEESRWHRVRSEEVWLHQRGGPLRLELGGTGARPAAGHAPQAVVPAGTWQRARPLTAAEALVSCVVSPGFDFADIEAVREG
jgi:predicted cupin superfamily sugar epimerase/uncharacterized protein (DUF952 family)